MQSKQITVLIILIVYLLINLGIGILVNRRSTQEGGFLSSYFIGSRGMGGIVLAMTLVATYTSASSFLGGPGLASVYGLSQSWIGGVQIGATFLTLGVLGKKLGLISRRINAVTVSDYLRARYQSSAVVIICGLALVVFFVTQMVAQFIGGATLIQTVTGVPYWAGLLLFGAVVVLYTAFGGFRAVVLTDTLQGIIMTCGTFLMLFFIIRACGGMDSIVTHLDAGNPGWDLMGKGEYGKDIAVLQPGYMLSYWVLVGVAVLGLPQTAVRCMGFRDTQSMHRAMLYGTVVIGILMIGMHLAGTLAFPLVEDVDLTSTDQVIPYVVMEYMPGWAAGFFLAAPLAAVMSTVDSLLLLSSATIIKDIYLNYIVKRRAHRAAESEDAGKNIPVSPLDSGDAGNTSLTEPAHSEWPDPDSSVYQANQGINRKSEPEPDSDVMRNVPKYSFLITAVLGITTCLIALNPPDVIAWINLFAFGGLEATFFWPLIGGLYWRKGNSAACIASTLTGLATFIFFNRVKILPFHIHEIVIALIVGGIVYFAVGRATAGEPDPEMEAKCF